MFKYRFICSDEGQIRSDIERRISNDLPCGKGLFGIDLFEQGIHFRECGDCVKGFYLAESEAEAHRGAPIRVSFKGRFTNEKDEPLFEVCIYPRIIELLFLIFAFLFLSVAGKILGFVIAVAVLLFFAKGYSDMIKETVALFASITSGR